MRITSTHKNARTRPEERSAPTTPAVGTPDPEQSRPADRNQPPSKK